MTQYCRDEKKPSRTWGKKPDRVCVWIDEQGTTMLGLESAGRSVPLKAGQAIGIATFLNDIGSGKYKSKK